MGLASYTVQRSFAGGELDPSLHARADLARYTQGARALENFLVRKSGGISNRGGTRYCGTAGAPDHLVRIYPWSFTAADQSVLIEAGDSYFRFWQDGALLEVDESSVPAWTGSEAYVQGDLVAVSGVLYYAVADNTGVDPTDASADEWAALPGTIYEIPTPYPAGAFNSPRPLAFSQANGIIRITHPGFAPMELQNLDVLGSQPRWVLVLVTTTPTIDPPVDHLSGTGGAVGTRTFRYKVTSLKEGTYEESLPSAMISVATAAVPTEAAPIVLEWDPVTGAVEYRVYLDPFDNGTFGLIGSATGQSQFSDVGFAPDFTRTPPIDTALFASSTNYPEVSTSYQQRSVFGYTDTNPAGLDFSRTGFRSNFSRSSPIQDDDAISVTISSLDNNVVRHLIPLKRLVVLTESAPVVVRGGEGGVLKPDAINLDPESDGGASRAEPAVAGKSIVYVHRGEHLVLAFTWSGDLDGTQVSDLTLMASHLFESRKIVKVVYQQDPHSIVWCLGDDGVLLGLTYVPSENIWAWHRHTTDGVIEDIAVVPEVEGDTLYLVVQRTIESTVTRYIERLARREGITQANLAARCIFADACATYDGGPTTTISGLDHLEGKRVSVVADGVVLHNGQSGGAGSFTVGSGEITLDAAASIVHVGLPIAYPQFESLSLDVEGSSVRGKKKRVQGVTAIVDRSSQGFYAGRTVSTLTRQQPKTWEAADELVSQGLEMSITASWDDDGRFVIRHLDPTPLTILALLPFIEVGG